MAPENSKAEAIRLTSSPAALSQNRSRMSRPAVEPIQKMQTNRKPEDGNPLPVSDYNVSENIPFSLPAQRKDNKPGTNDIQPFQLKGGNAGGQPVGPDVASGPVVQRMVDEGLGWNTRVWVNTGDNAGREARILMPYTNPGNTKEKGYFVRFPDGGLQRSYLYRELDPHWTKELERYSGTPAVKVAMLLREKYGGTNNDTYDGTSFNGIQKAILEKDIAEYTTLDDLLAVAEQKTDWGGQNGGALDDWLRKGEAFSIMELSYEDLKRLTEDITEIKSFDMPMALIDEGLWTDGMGPCITVAMTATCEGKRYNALLHSMDLSAGGKTVISSIVRLFDRNSPPLVPFNQLNNINFFVAGGNRSTLGKAESILRELADRKLQVSGVAIKSGDEEVSLTKAFLITSEGEVVYSMYDAKKVHNKS